MLQVFISADNILVLLFIVSQVLCRYGSILVYAKPQRINYHDDIVLRTPIVSIGERMLEAYFKNQSFKGSSILEIKYPNCEKDIQGILRD